MSRLLLIRSLSNVEDQLKKWIRTLRDPVRIFNRAIEANETEVLDANIAQLEKGQDALGNLLDQYASDEYAKFKKAMGSQSPLGIPDLKLEGDFHSGFVLKKDGKKFIITSTDEKKDRLKAKYGEDIFGVNFNENPDLLSYILESWITLFKQGL